MASNTGSSKRTRVSHYITSGLAHFQLQTCVHDNVRICRPILVKFGTQIHFENLYSQKSTPWLIIRENRKKILTNLTNNMQNNVNDTEQMPRAKQALSATHPEVIYAHVLVLWQLCLYFYCIIFLFSFLLLFSVCLLWRINVFINFTFGLAHFQARVLWKNSFNVKYLENVDRYHDGGNGGRI